MGGIEGKGGATLLPLFRKFVEEDGVLWHTFYRPVYFSCKPVCDLLSRFQRTMGICLLSPVKHLPLFLWILWLWWGLTHGVHVTTRCLQTGCGYPVSMVSTQCRNWWAQNGWSINRGWPSQLREMVVLLVAPVRKICRIFMWKWCALAHLCTYLPVPPAILDPKIGHYPRFEDWLLMDLPPLILFSTDLSKQSPVSPVHFVMFSCRRVLGLPLLLWLEVVPCIISFSMQFPSFHSTWP